MGEIKFEIKNVKGEGLAATMVSLEGGLDTTNIPQFTTVADKLIQRGVKHLILDLSKVTYIGSVWDATFIKYTDVLKEMGGHFALVRVPKKVIMVLKMLGFDKALAIYPDETAAVASFKS